jgi:hypothetical protein
MRFLILILLTMEPTNLRAQLPDDEPAPPRKPTWGYSPPYVDYSIQLEVAQNAAYRNTDVNPPGAELVAALQRRNEIGEPEQKLGLQEWLILIGIVAIIFWSIFLRQPRQRER